MITEFIHQPWAFYSSIFLLLLGLLWWRRQNDENAVLRDLPFVGDDGYPLAKLRAKLMSFGRGRVYLLEAYHKYGKHGQSCILPSILGNQVLVPPSLVPWMLDQPENVLSSKEAQIDFFEATHALLRPEVANNPTHEAVVRKQLKTRLSELLPGIHEEISASLEDLLGQDTVSYKSVNLDDTIRATVGRASNRAFVGRPLCRDPTFVSNAVRFVDCVPASGLLLKLYPPFIRSLAAKVLMLGNRIFYARCARHLDPFFADRIEAWRQQSVATEAIYADWSVADAMEKDDPGEKTPDMLSHRMMALNFAAIHTSTMTTTNYIMDIASGPDAQLYMSELRRESAALNAKYGNDQWDVSRIAQMTLSDSALRESMRLSGFAGKGFPRKIVARDGLQLPDGGIWIPAGNIVCIPAWPMHHDEMVYKDPSSFMYDRFTSARQQRKDGTTTTPPKTATTTDTQFAVWGHGKHACPGRFFAVAVVKMIVDVLLEKYEIRPWEQRPSSMWVEDSPVPRRSVMMGVRRRRTRLVIDGFVDVIDR